MDGRAFEHRQRGWSGGDLPGMLTIETPRDATRRVLNCMLTDDGLGGTSDVFCGFETEQDWDRIECKRRMGNKREYSVDYQAMW